MSKGHAVDRPAQPESKGHAVGQPVGRPQVLTVDGPDRRTNVHSVHAHGQKARSTVLAWKSSGRPAGRPL